VAAPRLDPKKIAAIKRLRAQGFSIPEIQEKLGVSHKVIVRYGKGIVKKKRKSKLEIAQRKKATIHSDETIAKHLKKDVKDVTSTDRNSYRGMLGRKKNPSGGSFSAALNKLKKDIIRIFPDSDKILKNRKGKLSSLNDILNNKILRKKYGGLIDVAFNAGLDTTKRNAKGATALKELRSSINELDPKPKVSPDSKRFNPKQDVIQHKAREFAARSGTTPQDPLNRALSRTWYTNLTPAQRVDARAPLEYRHIFNQYLRDKKGRIYPKHRMVYHHNMPLGYGGAQTANPAHVTVMKGSEHDKLHGSSKMNQLFEQLKRRGITTMPDWAGLKTRGGGGGMGIIDFKSGRLNFGPYRRQRKLY